MVIIKEMQLYVSVCVLNDMWIRTAGVHTAGLWTIFFFAD